MRIVDSSGADAAAQVRTAFEWTLGREPDEIEQLAAATLVSEHNLAALCRALYNSNEFLFLP